MDTDRLTWTKETDQGAPIHSSSEQALTTRRPRRCRGSLRRRNASMLTNARCRQALLQKNRSAVIHSLHDSSENLNEPACVTTSDANGLPSNPG